MRNTIHRNIYQSGMLGVLVMGLLPLSGCPNRELKPLTPCIVSGVVAKVKQNPADKIDVLFVVDNSFSMDAEQKALSAEFEAMIQILVTGDTDADGKQDNPPVTDLHLGVVTTDLGIGGLDVTGPICGFSNRTEGVPAALGDDGVLQTKGDEKEPTCEESYPAFLAYACDDDECSTPAKESERTQLAKDFACVANLGIGGCGLEQPLEAALKALSDPAAADPVTFTVGQGHGGADDPFNGGFLRPDSLLTIVVVTDEEDCSSPDPQMFAENVEPPVQQEIAYRCADQPWGNADRLYPVSRYVDGFLKLREGREDLLVFAAITGVPQALVDANTSENGNYNFDAILGDNEDPNHPLTQVQQTTCIYNPNKTEAAAVPALRHSCGKAQDNCGPGFSADDQFAFPPRRIVEVASGLAEPTGGNTLVQSICPPAGSNVPNFRTALNQILTKIGDALTASTCLPRELRRNSAGEVNCSVLETMPVGVTCDSQPGRTLKDVKNGQEVCIVAQLSTKSDQTQVPEGEGWYYDDFTTQGEEPGEDSPRVKYCGDEGRRVAFTSPPVAGSSVGLECTQPVKSASSNEPGVLGAACGGDPDCAAGLQCEPNSNSCQYTCSTNVDCSEKASSAFVCNLEEGATKGYCVTPTCQ
ncbi:MAG: hypothetical protein H6715_05800 [Myxococcales bacterium]|nr:hypothetical protein [Myxococcales bacterium]